MKKHGYGYLEEIVVRRADNDLYRFLEGDFPSLRINDIEDMLLFVLQNRVTNLSGDDVFDFALALRMFTRSLVIQKRVEDLQSDLKVTKRRSTSPSHKLPYSTSKKGTHTLHIKTLKDSFMLTKMEETELRVILKYYSEDEYCLSNIIQALWSRYSRWWQQLDVDESDS
ncbi:hypothetical protein Tco_0699939 [Tanacetum coccineum]